MLRLPKRMAPTIAPTPSAAKYQGSSRSVRAEDAPFSQPCRAIHHAINPMRARVLAAGVAILEALLDRYDLDRIHVVDTSIREGAVLAATRGGTDWRTGLEGLARGWRH